MHYYKGNPSNLAYICIKFDSPKWVPFNDRQKVPFSHQEIPKVRPKTVVRFSRERQSYSVHCSDYAPGRWWMVWRDVGLEKIWNKWSPAMVLTSSEVENLKLWKLVQSDITTNPLGFSWVLWKICCFWWFPWLTAWLKSMVFCLRRNISTTSCYFPKDCLTCRLQCWECFEVLVFWDGKWQVLRGALGGGKYVM